VRRPYIVAHSGAFLRKPDGGGGAGIGHLGGGWLALNVGDGLAWSDWNAIIGLATPAGVRVLPWKRCRTLAECAELLELAERVSVRGILNIEDEFERGAGPGEPAACPPNKVAELLAHFDVAVAFSTGGWLMNDVDYRPIGHRPVLLQMFPQDMHRDPSTLPQVTADCIANAHAHGFRHVGITCQTYGTDGASYGKAQPEWYAFLGAAPRSLYTGDDVGDWSAWLP
jgi:hypothetical protein